MYPLLSSVLDNAIRRKGDVMPKIIKRPIIDLNLVPEQFFEETWDLKKRISEFKESCKHKWEKVMKYDPNYSPKIDKSERGAEIISHFHCSLCNSNKLFVRLRTRYCHKCSGKMKYDRETLIKFRYPISGASGNETFRIYKCEDCGHEYEHKY